VTRWPDQGPRSPSPTLRRQAAARYGDRCIYCAAQANHLDHVVPYSRGGPTLLRNLRPACRRCGTAKGALTPVEWLGDACPDALAEVTRRVLQSIDDRAFHPRPRPAQTGRAATSALRLPSVRRFAGPGGPGGRTLQRRPPP
jgi:hypothetical protein